MAWSYGAIGVERDLFPITGFSAQSKAGTCLHFKVIKRQLAIEDQID